MTTPARHGSPWLDEEIQKLLEGVRKKQTQVQIAEAHQRSQGSIRAKLRGLAADYYFNDNRPLDQIMKFTGLDAETISDAISKRQYVMDMKEKKDAMQTTLCFQTQVPEVKKDGMISLLTEIRDMMKEILTIIKEERSHK